MICWCRFGWQSFVHTWFCIKYVTVPCECDWDACTEHDVALVSETTTIEWQINTRQVQHMRCIFHMLLASTLKLTRARLTVNFISCEKRYVVLYIVFLSSIFCPILNHRFGLMAFELHATDNRLWHLHNWPIIVLTLFGDGSLQKSPNRICSTFGSCLLFRRLA